MKIYNLKKDDVLKAKLSDWPLPDEFLIEIGRLTSMWTALEATLDLYLGKLAGYDDIFDVRPFILLKHSSITQKLDSFATLCEQLEKEFPQLKSYKDVIALIKSAQNQRNKFAHNTISLDPDTGFYMLAHGSARGKIKTSLEQIKPINIKEVSMQIHLATIALHELIMIKQLDPIWLKKK